MDPSPGLSLELSEDKRQGSIHPPKKMRKDYVSLLPCCEVKI